MPSQTFSFRLTPVTARAYDFLKARILNGKLKPGQFLSAGKLSAEIGMSRTPIKDALRYLQSDGLVSIAPKVGAVVTSFEEEELREMLGYRKALETYAIEETCRLPHAVDLEALALVVQNLREHMGSSGADGARRMVDLCQNFHRLIVRSARNGQISRRFDGLQQMLHIYIPGDGFSRSDEGGALQREVSEFEEMLLAIRAQDGARARQILGANLDRSAAGILEFFLARAAEGSAFAKTRMEIPW